ncbi:MAG: circadian clock KaiB family protein [Balneolales bacterium]
MNSDAGQKVEKPEQVHYSLILFVISEGDHSKRARENLERLCEQWLPQRHHIKVVDVVEDFQTALDYNILLTPSVVVTSPEPLKIIHGDLSDARKFAEVLNLYEEGKDDR